MHRNANSCRIASVLLLISAILIAVPEHAWGQTIADSMDESAAPVMDEPATGVSSGDAESGASSLVDRSLRGFQFKPDDFELVPRDYFSERVSAETSIDADQQLTSLHHLELVPPCLVHRRLYFEQPNLERCGQCRKHQEFASAAQFFRRGLLFPVMVFVVKPWQIECTDRNCPQ